MQQFAAIVNKLTKLSTTQRVVSVLFSES